MKLARPASIILLLTAALGAQQTQHVVGFMTDFDVKDDAIGICKAVMVTPGLAVRIPMKKIANNHIGPLSNCISVVHHTEESPMPALQNKVAVVTGSGSGIGQAIAIRLASEGATIVVDYRNHADQAAETKAKCEAAGGEAITIQADVSVLADTQRLIDETYKQLGRCDILVNNAGIEISAPFWDVTEKDYDAVLNVNLKGAFFLTQAFVRPLIKAKQPGRIINISSVHEDMAFPHFSTYCVSKGGMRMLMRNLAVELGPFNITVNNIAPGAIATPINTKLLTSKPELKSLLANIPLGRLGAPEDVAGLALFLASNDGAYCTGSTFIVDGGLIRNYHEQ